MAPPLRIHSCRVKWSPDNAETTVSGTTATWLDPLKEKTRDESEEGRVGRAEVQLAAGDGGGRRSTSPLTAPDEENEREGMNKNHPNLLSIHVLRCKTRAHHTAVAQICQSSCLCRSPSRCGRSGALRWPGCSTQSPRRSPDAGWGTGGCYLTRVCTPHAWSILEKMQSHNTTLNIWIQQLGKLFEMEHFT